MMFKWISSRLERGVPEDVRDRGLERLVDPGVVIEEGTAKRVKARVEGKCPSRVTLSCQGPELVARCTCAGFGEYPWCCEHVWATIGWSEMHAGLLTALPANKAIHLVLDVSALVGETAEPCRLEEGTVFYLVDRERVLEAGDLVVEVYRGTSPARSTAPGAERSRAVKPRDLGLGAIAALPDPLDRRICAALMGVDVDEGLWRTYRLVVAAERGLVLEPQRRDGVLPLLLQSGRLHYRDRRSSPKPRLLALDGGAPWSLRLEVRSSADGEHWEVGGRLERGGEELGIGEPSLLLVGGWGVHDGRVFRLEDHGAFQWISQLRREGPLRVARAREQDLLERLWRAPGRPPVDWPEELKLEEVRVEPRPLLRVERSKDDPRDPPRLRATLGFFYEGMLVEYGCTEAQLPDLGRRRLLVRRLEAEGEHRDALAKCGLTPPPLHLVRRRVFAPMQLEMRAERLPSLARELAAAGWHVEAEGKLCRNPSRFRYRVAATGVDWFDLHVDCAFGEQQVALPELLAAVERGEGYVVLDDGTLGVLPEAWLERYKLLVATGQLRSGCLRFRRSQVAILDILVDARTVVSGDAAFEQARAELYRFEGVAPEAPGGEFAGELRPYQEEGLGWLRFLSRFGLGGCLADDMGLGKTVQALALLEGRRAGGDCRGKPSLVVTPRSVVFNWLCEARRFAPRLRVFEYTGRGRTEARARLDEFDLLVTTYGTLVRDAAELARVNFDHVILDEAQAIKNSSSASAKAARLLKADHRLALTGTPVENHLGELWSILEFLNPGMAGAASAFKRLNRLDPDDGALRQLSRALRPVILRRTKQQVARELPRRVEQTIFCELEPRHRREYEEVRDHYRAKLVELLDGDRSSSAGVRVLEALLRLRQAACHPGLLDKRRASESSAKLSILLERLLELDSEGNKALIFSQFTTLLGIVRKQLDAHNVRYEYLDGRTRDRARKVARFQEDPACKLFLVSLKAGGVGLNLTAAEYVFVLDPWWNPAVEAQAIDRAHRIGQRRKVFAYRLIARGTVEERIVELQQRKRRLAEEILGGGKGILHDLKREDLELLLS